MGFISDGTHDNMLNNTDWRTMDTCPEYTDVYLKCNLMIDDFVVIGQVGNGARIKSDGDPDVFFRSAILFWKPLEE